MATTKKTTTKSTPKKAAPKAAAAKAAPKKTTTIKKTVAKKAPAKKTTAKKGSAAAASMKSFQVAKPADSFSTFRITRQTVYWIILVAFIVFAQLWILKLQIEVATLIEAQQAQIME